MVTTGLGREAVGALEANVHTHTVGIENLTALNQPMVAAVGADDTCLGRRKAIATLALR